MTEQFPRNGWYAVGGAAALRPGDVMPVHLFGEERMAWRGEDGNSHVWQNRCVHRGMRLQYGFVDGDRLACRYHGWRFDSDAQCVHIPAHPDMTPPDDYCVPGFPSAEAGGLIWTATGTPDTDLPRVSGMDDFVFCRTITVHAGAATVAAAFDRIRFRPFGGKTASSYSLERPVSGLAQIDATGTSQSLLLAVQPSNDARCQVHILAKGRFGDDMAAPRKHFAAWACRFRWHVENGLPEDTIE